MAGAALEVVGKVVGVGLKDVGKGKDAVAHEVIVVTVKIDQQDGICGSLTFVPGDQESQFELRDPVRITISQPQGKLGLARGSRSQASAGH